MPPLRKPLYGPFDNSGAKRTTLSTILSKYPGSHHWDFGVSADKVAAGLSMTPSQFAAAYPLHHLYQDAAGTTPAFLPTHPVGLCLDQPAGSVVLGTEVATGSYLVLGGGTVNQSTLPVLCTSSVAGVYGAHPVGALVVGNWYKVTVSWSGNTSGRPIVANAMGTVVFGSSVSGTKTGYYQATHAHQTVFVVGTAAGESFSITAYSCKPVTGIHAFQSTTTKRPLLSARVNLLLATAALSTQSVTTLAASYKLTFTGAGTVTLSGTYVGSLVGGGSLTFTATAGTLTLTVTGSVTLADLRLANSPTNLPAYQRVTSATDYDTVGFPLRAYWNEQGVDDWVQLASVPVQHSDDYSIHIAAMITSVGATRILYSQSNASSHRGPWIYFNATGTISFQFYDGVSSVDATSPLSYANTPIIIRCRKIGSVVSLWVNGDQVATANVASLSISALTDAFIATYTGGGLTFVGPTGMHTIMKGTETDADGLLVDRELAKKFPVGVTF
jgi:hypothetical protein